ncbi:MAG: diguanylate cyclase, partial [Myxococcota bacterium]
MAEPTYALVYMLVAFVVTFQGTGSALGVVALALLLEGLTGQVWASRPWVVTVLHMGFIVAFGGLSLVLARWDRRAGQLGHAEHGEPLGGVSSTSQQLLESARALRLSAARGGGGGVVEQAREARLSREQAEEQLALEAVEAITSVIHAHLTLLRTGLGCNMVVLLWNEEQGSALRVRGSAGPSRSELVESASPGEGVLAEVVRRREPVVLEGLTEGEQRLSYYQVGHADGVRSFAGAPVLDEQGELCGVVCADWGAARIPLEGALKAIRETGDAIVRAIWTERLFLSMEKTRYEVGRLYAASKQLNQALTPHQVYEVALTCVEEICRYDAAAFVRTHQADDGRMTHEVVLTQAAKGAGVLRGFAERIEGATFAHNTGLVSMAIEMGRYLPYDGVYHEGRSVVFTRERPLRGAKSLLVLPMVAQDKAMGACVLACAAPGQFPDGRRKLLEVLATQVAISLQNAQMYAQMEQMATIDGLTQLHNRRAFAQKLTEVLARSQRSEQPFCLLLTDIDHFKSINDTYGHPVGDEVLRQVSRTFQHELRQTDIAARYGGEEFAIILEATDLEGALQIGERLREAVASVEFTSLKGPFRITMSFGI